MQLKPLWKSAIYNSIRYIVLKSESLSNITLTLLLTIPVSKYVIDYLKKKEKKKQATAATLPCVTQKIYVRA